MRDCSRASGWCRSDLLGNIGFGHKEDHGLNVKKLLDDPPADLFNFTRINEKGIDAKYLEAERGKKLFDQDAVFAVFRLFDGPFGFAYAARLN